MADGPLIEARELSLTYPPSTERVVDRVSLQVQHGEFLAIAGPSGSGKSSLLQMLGALQHPTQGDVIYAGMSYAQAGNLSDFRRRHIGFVFQSFHLIPTLSALQNVALPGLGWAGTPASLQQRAMSLLAGLGLEHRMHHRPAMLSGGERQRVALARALINSPQLILADEPTGSLDSHNAAEVVRLLQQAQHDHGVALIVVTHDPDIARAADRQLAMRDGRLH